MYSSQVLLIANHFVDYIFKAPVTGIANPFYAISSFAEFENHNLFSSAVCSVRFDRAGSPYYRWDISEQYVSKKIKFLFSYFQSSEMYKSLHILPIDL